MQILTKDGVRAAVLKAMEDGTLGALKPRTRGAYLYDDGAKCAIGCAFDAETLARVLEIEKAADDYYSMRAAEFKHVFSFEAGIAEWLWDLQFAHDAWARADVDEREDARLEFLRILES